jgi:hypothetical protein
MEIMSNDNKITRREALQKTVLLAGGLFTPSLLRFGYGLMGSGSPAQTDAVTDEDIFFISRVAEALQNNPVEDAESALSVPYQHNYTIFFTVQKEHPVIKGAIAIEREPLGLAVKIIRKGTLEHHQFVNIRQTLTKSSLIGTPAEWTYETRFSTEDGKPLYGIPVTGHGYMKDGAVCVNELSHRRIYPLQKPDFTLSWNLMDAVQHVADTQLPLQFDVIDECDIYGGLKTLQLFKHAKVSINGTVRRLKSYILTGTGTLPRFYWLNENGRLLFVNSGMEVYVLQGGINNQLK